MKGKREILIVDEDDGFRKTLTDILAAKGYEPIAVANAEDALEEVETKKPAVAIVDLKLPDMDGLELIKKLKEISPGSEYILLTGYASQESAIKAANVGIFSYLEKPYDINQLLLVINSAAHKCEVEKGLRASEKRYRTLFEAATEGIVIADLKTKKLKYANPALSKMLGYSVEELGGMSISDLHPKGALVHVLSEFETQARGEKTLAENIPCLRKDGKTIFVDVNTGLVNIDGAECNVGFFTDITERRRQAKELKEHREHLQELIEERTFHLVRAVNDLQKEIRDRKKVEITLRDTVQFKTDFLANTSHELRTPLNSIIGYTDLILKDDSLSLPAKRKKNLEAILVNADMLLMLISNILDMAKVEKGKMKIQYGKLDFPVLVDSCIASVDGLIKDKPVEIFRDINKDVTEFHADQDKLQQIIANLLSNAVKFTDKGEVRLSAKLHPGKEGLIVITVSDTGIGIAKEKQKTIFEEFKQIDASSTRKHDGIGLGLAIAKSYVDILGGEISVESEPGKGSKFTVILPVTL